MKVEVKDGKQKEEIKYPCLMQSTETMLIVLFRGVEHGVVIKGDELNPLGSYCSNWNADMFKPFTDSITLSND